MSNNLVIVESPNKIKHIKGYLEDLYPSEKWEVAASVGHFTELSKESGTGYVTAGVMSNTYLTDMVVSDSKKSVFAKLKSLTKAADRVYLATDDDREGEAIADSLMSFLRIKSPIRVRYKEITKNGIMAAMENAGSIDADLVVAQRARRVFDRLVGFLVSPELYRLMGVPGVSAGRVQSPVLRLIYERGEAIRLFKANNYYDVVLTGKSEAGVEFKAKLDTKPFVGEDGYFTDAALAVTLSTITDLSLADFKESERLKNPPSPLTTSLMQQVASGELKIKPKDVMQAAQGLFEAGLITYHRTDNPNLSEETYQFIKGNFSSLGVVDEQRMFKSKDGAQEGHPAITPTDLFCEVAGSTETEKNLYRIIRAYAIASQLLPAKYKVRKAVLKGDHDGTAVVFNASGSELIEKGYLSFLDDKDSDDEKEEGESSLLPDLNYGFNIVKGDVFNKKTKPPALYTVKSLLAKLDSLGIGRPATLDGIFETLERRKYIEIDGKNNLSHTEHGEKILLRLIGHFEFVEYQFTADMEDELDKLAVGNANYVQVMRAFHSRLSNEIDQLKTQKSDVEIHLCPSCNNPLKRFYKKSEYDFWGCTNRDHCKYTADNIEGKPVERKKAVLSDHICPKCNERLVHRFKANSHDFWGCSGYPNCDYSADNKEGVPVERPAAEHSCPKCSSALVRRTKTGKGGYDFWGCTGFKKGCKTSFKVAEDGSPVILA